MGFEDLMIFGYLSLMVMAVLAIWLFFKYAFKGKLKKNLISFFTAVGKYLAEKMRRFVERYSRRGDFDDERESIFGGLRLLNIFRRKKDGEARSKYGGEISWNRLKTNRERIRYIYRHFVIFCIDAGFTFNNKRTPNQVSADILTWDPETGRESPYLTDLYNEARYGPDDSDISNEKVDDAQDRTKEIEDHA